MGGGSYDNSLREGDWVAVMSRAEIEVLVTIVTEGDKEDLKWESLQDLESLVLLLALPRISVY